MSKTNYSLCANAVVRYLQKDAGEITREDFRIAITQGKISEEVQVAIKTKKAVEHLTRKEEDER